MKQLVSLVILLVLIFSLVACKSSDNNNGNQNTTGDNTDVTGSNFDKNKVSYLSAYEEASRLGFEGSLDDFIALISGKNGKDGVSIINVIIDNSGDLLVILSNGETIKCGKVTGSAGKDGLTPTIEISADGYWIINGIKTEHKAIGTNGENGAPGKDGVNGITPTIEISADGYWIINGVKTEYKAIGTDGENGAPGNDGVNGTTPTIEISADGYWIINGIKTEHKAIGTDGENGATGNNGITPIIKLEGGELWVSYDSGSTWNLLGNVNDKVCHHRDIDDNYYCDYCNNPYSDGVDTPADPDHTHNFGAWKCFSTTQDYCDEALYYRTCPGCNIIDWRDGTEDDHSYTIVTTYPTCTTIGYDTKTCSDCGKTVNFNETAIIPHTYYDSYSFDASYHWKECKYCGHSKDKDEHTIDSSNICILCDEPLGPTAGIIYDVSIDGTYAEVLGYEGTATKIVIADTYKGLPVKNIFADVFRYNNNIVSVIIPESVTSIPDDAFNGCSNLTSVTIPDSVTSIGNSAFGVCYNLTSVTIPDSVTSIGGNVFGGCSKLTSVTFEENSKLTSIGGGAFSGCSNLTTITIPDGVTEIGYQAFYRCYNLASITIPDSVSVIGSDAFRYCSKLTSVTIPDGVIIGSGAFLECSSALYTEYEYGMYIGDENNPYAILYELTNKNFTTYNIHSSTKVIAYGVFSGCSRLTNIEIPASVTSISDGAFSNCTNLNSVHITDMASWFNITFCGYVGPGDPTSNPLAYAKNLYLNGALVTNLVIPDGVSEIKVSTFYNCTSLKSVSFDSNVTKINDLAFYGCSGLTSIYIPSSVTSIGAKAFYNCTNLKSASVSSSVISVGEDAFEECHSSLYTIYEGGKYIGSASNPHAILCGLNNNYSSTCTIHSNTRIIADYAFSYSYMNSVTIPNGVTHIGNNAFSSCSNLTSIIIPNTVTSIGHYAFNYCSNLTSVTVGKGVTSIGIEAFLNCYALNSVNIKDVKAWCGISFSKGDSNPLHIAKNLYLNDNLVTELVIPSGTTSICDGAFAYCTSFTSVIIPATVEKIGDMAFYGCKLKSAEIPTYAIDHIDKRTLEYVTITSGERIESGAFKNCIWLKSLKISSCVTSIGDDAFLGCQIKIADLPAFAFAHISKDNLQIVVINSGDIENGTFKGCQYLKSVTISDDVKVIGDEAFAYCPALTYVTIPTNIEKVGAMAFAHCENLEKVMIHRGISEFASDAFAGCTNLIAVYYYGTIEEWAKITIVGDDSLLDSVPLYFYSSSQPTENGNFWHYVNGNITLWEAEIV